VAVTLEAPFPWFGGKRDVAPQVWAALGNVAHYVEPFFGSGAVLLQRPHAARFETINDIDGMVANFWRAAKSDPQGLADAADWPCNEADLHARHLWLVGQRDRLTERLMGDAEWHDPKAAGWWLWGACNWIGSGWCSGKGPWIAVDGEIKDCRQLPHLSSAQGVNRQLPHLSEGRGVNRQRFILQWITALQDRLRDVRIACGDWSRVTGPAVLDAGGGMTGVFLDPPYSSGEHSIEYAQGQTDVAGDVLRWCVDNGSIQTTRIVLAGYDGEHNALEGQGWRSVAWKARGGYGSQGDGRGRENSSRERLWLSPHCMGVAPDLFAELAA
jgi:site-specific DNA-adenine methylase